MYEHDYRGRAAAVREVPTFHKKMILYDKIVQTTNQAATRVQTLTVTIEY